MSAISFQPPKKLFDLLVIHIVTYYVGLCSGIAELLLEKAWRGNLPDAQLLASSKTRDL